MRTRAVREGDSYRITGSKAWEKLTTLEQLPPFGFKVACFPVKIEAASAGWTRCVAMVDN